MININNNICKTVVLIVGVCGICYLSKLAIDNDYEPEFHFKNHSFRLNKNKSNKKTLLMPNNIEPVAV